jgi:AcrR family transcriptional regulator
MEDSRFTLGYASAMASLPDSLTRKPAGKERVPKEVMAEHQRDRVLTAAVEVFAKRGYPGTTVDHIVSAAKIGVGNFYNLFGGKEECFLQAYDRVVDSARSQIVESVPADAEWPVQAREALRSLLEAIAADPLRARLALVEVQTAGPEALKRHEGTIEATIPLLERGREASPVAAELPKRLEEAIAGGLAWFLQQRVVVGDLGDVDARLSDAMEIVVEPYIGRDATRDLL